MLHSLSSLKIFAGDVRKGERHTMVIVTRRKRESLVPVLFYYSNDEEAP